MNRLLLMQRVGILLIFLVTCSPVICQSTKNNPQNAPDGLKVDPAIFGLRELLYCDAKLNEWVNQIPESYKLQTEALRDNPELKNSVFFNEKYQPLAEAVLLIREGNSKQAERALEASTNERLKQEIDYWMVLAYAKHQLGDLIGARKSLRRILTLPDKEIGFRLLAWSMLRELGDKPEEQIADEVLGVIVELGLENTVIVVSGFADGMSRFLLLRGGGGPIGGPESFPKETVIAAKNMVSVAQPLVRAFPLEKARQLPKQGRVRFALLTAGGIHVKDESIQQLDHGMHPSLHSLNTTAQQLFDLLLKFNLEQSKK